ncbi:MAG: hypothetical protein WCG97_00670 [bacterium]
MSPHLNPENLHHATIIFSPVSSFNTIIDYISKNILEKGTVAREFRHTDFINLEMVSIGADDVSIIADFNSRRALGENKVMIISTQAITGPAQNALLKIIEEPSSNTFFFFIIPSKSQILPTLLSRFREISTDQLEGLKIEHSNSPTLNPENFLQQSTATRMEIIKEVLVFLEKEKITRGQISEFISEVIALRYAKQKLFKSSMKAIISIEHFMRDTASSMKMCLEYLALVL